MLVPISWLERFVIINLTAEELAMRLNLAGLEVESIVDNRQKYMNIVVGQIKSVEKHPNADKLRICQIDISQAPVTAHPNNQKGIIQIVTGAENIQPGSSEGKKVPVALLGAEVASGLKMKPVKLRGVDSNGMLCSQTELGLETESAGIFILGDAATVGDRVSTFLGIDEVILDIAVLPNRPDCLSMVGIAREIAVILDRPMKADNYLNLITTVDSLCPIQVKNLDYEKCPRYMGRYIRDVKVAPSPAWMQNLLRHAGIRPINNVVDITNFILLEYGQPLHSFDADRIRGAEIVVRKANTGEEMITLDSEKHTLTNDDLLITDKEGGVALAGIMGGANSEITDATVNVFLESACFQPQSIRRTSRRTSLRSESSARFERGVDWNGVNSGINKACWLLQEFAGGHVLETIIDHKQKDLEPLTISFDPALIQKTLGIEVPTSIWQKYLTALGYTLNPKGLVWEVAVPSHRRHDSTRPIDLIEEICRLYGLEKIPSTLPQPMYNPASNNSTHHAVARIKEILCGAGFSEAVNYGLTSNKNNQTVNKSINEIMIANPLSPQTETMRTSLLGGLLSNLIYHESIQIRDLRLFEVGNIFPDKCSEQLSLGAIATGAKNSQDWQQRNQQCDFYTIKGLADNIVRQFGSNDVVVEKLQDERFHPGHSAQLCLEKNILIKFGRLHPQLIENISTAKEIYYLEVAISKLPSAKSTTILQYSGFPAVRRDLSLIVGKQSHSSIMNMIKTNSGDMLEELFLKDIFVDNKFGEGKQNNTYTLIFRHPERTFTDEEINTAIEKIKTCLRDKLSLETM